MLNLYENLRDLRRRLAESEGVEVFRVFNNATLDELVEKKPSSKEELLEVKGMGERKVFKYGAAILKAISNFQFPISNEVSNVIPDSTSESSSTGNPESTSELSWAEASVGMAEEGMQKQVISVGQYVEYLNLVLQRTADVKVVGEVSAAKLYPSGLYFTLKDKDDESALSCYIPTYTYRGLGIPLEDGMEVSVEGMPRLVKRNGRFQFIVENLELVGEGALKKAYDLLKAKLEAEGLFARKRELPEFITSVGIITSRAGAVIHDFRNNLASLGIKLYLKDVRVEGASSPGMIVKAIKYFNAHPKNTDKMDSGFPAASQGAGHVEAGMTSAVDVIVIMRGGGSLEDLQGFNSEQVVRAVFGSQIPTVIAIGHDKDVPLAQLAADVMVSTPTAAAHAVSATWNRLVEDLPQMEASLLYNFSGHLNDAQSRYRLMATNMANWCSRLSQSHTRLQLGLLTGMQRYAEWITQAHAQVVSHVGRMGQMQVMAQERVRIAVSTAASFLEQVNPERQLTLGYSIVKNAKGKIVRSVKDVTVGEGLKTNVADGTIESVVK